MVHKPWYPGVLARVARLFHTLRYLRPVQIYGRLRMKLQRPMVDLSPAPAVRPPIGKWAAPVRREVSLLSISPLTFRFLNEEHAVAEPGDWDNPAINRLWRYNLHYFDDLNARDSELHSECHREWLARWLRENPPARGTGWEPYPSSLRIVNWIKWVLSGNTLPEGGLHSLAVQIRWLARHLEIHLLGNHLLANAKALVFAGLFFQGKEAVKWLGQGMEILARELPEQILPDGGNFERSPMYHGIIMEDLLDLINLYRAFSREIPTDWENVHYRMRAWLKAMIHPDGKIALFNDAAFGIAPEWDELDAYAGRLGLPRQEYPSRSLTRFSETGYIRCEGGEGVLLLDVAPVGPDYLPGHAHADTLNFEFSLFGRRVIVDSGTSTYENNENRQRQRGTAAHNTVTIDGENSSEVWGGFRVARRARPFDLEVENRAGKVRVTCAHDGYRRLPGRVVHRREWRLDSHSLHVRDAVEGKFREGIARYHFHPEVEVKLLGPKEGRGALPGGRPFSIRVERGAMRLVGSTYHPEFNIDLPNRCLELVLEGAVAGVIFSWE